MKHIRILSALTCCAALVSASSGALAAPNPATAKPTLKITAPSGKLVSGTYVELTVTASDPGFLTLTLQDQSGVEVLTLFEKKEIHSSSNIVTITLSDETNAALQKGAYTVSGSVINQYGNTSDLVSASMDVVDPAADPENEETDGKADTKTATKANSSSTKTSSKQTSTTKSTSDTLTYAASANTMLGDEGYQIGIGVSDTADQSDTGYWGLTAKSDDEAIWKALTRPMRSVDVAETESAYIYDSTDRKTQKKLGTVSGLTQGLNVITEVDGGWSLVEAYRNEDGAFVRGYILTKKLRTVEPNTTYGIVIDKAAQELIVFKEGERIGSCAISTGLATKKYPQRETPAGEFITATRHGTSEYYGTGRFSKYTIRFSGNYRLREIPTTKKGGSDFSYMEGSLGEKASRGDICIAHDASKDGGINAQWIWDMTEKNKKIKVLIFDDKDRDQVPVTK